MSCEKCGMPCEGEKCRVCDRMDHQEDYYGVPSDHFDERDDRTDTDDWTVAQQSLDGESQTGQATLDGGVAKDGGSR